jgi:primosomal replication protein N
MYKNMKNFLFLLLCNICLQAMAHHGWSEYDQTNLVKLSGTVAQSGYEHPHGFISLVSGEKTFTAVLAPPFRMENRGLKPENIAVGARVVVEGYIHRSKPNELKAERIVVNNKVIELR